MCAEEPCVVYDIAWTAIVNHKSGKIQTKIKGKCGPRCCVCVGGVGG